MSRRVHLSEFADPIPFEIVDAPEPHAGPGQLRVRVAAAGLNPIDWKIAAIPGVGERFGITAPNGFGNDLAGTVDEVGEGVTGFAVGDRVFGGAQGRAAAPDGVAAALDLAGVETVHAALEVGVAPERIGTIAAGPNPPGGAVATGGTPAFAPALDGIAASLASGEFVLPIAATFPLDRIADAVALQRTGHVRGKVVLTVA